VAILAAGALAAPLACAARDAGRLAVAPGAPPGAAGAPAMGAASIAAKPAVGNPKSRFFLSGDGVIALQNEHTGDRLRVPFRDARRAFSPAALAKIGALFRSRGDDEETRVSLRLVELIDFVEDRWQPKSIHLLSGYRSGEYNAALIAHGGKQARTSMHTEG